MAGKRSDAATIRREELTLECLRLRKQGLSVRAIVAKLAEMHNVTLSKATVHTYYKRALSELVKQRDESADELRQMELERLDALLVKINQIIGEPKDEPNFIDADTKIRAINSAIKLSESRRELLGLDAPQKIAPTTPDGEGLIEAVLILPVKKGNDASGEPITDQAG